MVLLESFEGLEVKFLLNFVVIPNVGRSFVPTLMSTGVSSCKSPKCLSSNTSTAFDTLLEVLLGDPNEALISIFYVGRKQSEPF